MSLFRQLLLLIMMDNMILNEFRKHLENTSYENCLNCLIINEYQCEIVREEHMAKWVN